MNANGLQDDRGAIVMFVPSRVCPDLSFSVCGSYNIRGEEDIGDVGLMIHARK